MDIPFGSPLVALLEERKTQIQAAETLGPLLALWYGNKLIARSSCSFFIDNLSGMCCLQKGGSRRVDLSAINLGVSLGVCRFDVRPWWDYVESASNVADGGSRVGLADPDAAAMGIKLQAITDFKLPDGFPLSTPSQWDSWWGQADEASARFLASSTRCHE